MATSPDIIILIFMTLNILRKGKRKETSKQINKLKRNNNNKKKENEKEIIQHNFFFV